MERDYTTHPEAQAGTQTEAQTSCSDLPSPPSDESGFTTSNAAAVVVASGLHAALRAAGMLHPSDPGEASVVSVDISP